MKAPATEGAFWGLVKVYIRNQSALSIEGPKRERRIATSLVGQGGTHIHRTWSRSLVPDLATASLTFVRLQNVSFAGVLCENRGTSAKKHMSLGKSPEVGWLLAFQAGIAGLTVRELLQNIAG
ncbi:unnamed protein product [Haemonchus placei]|uniref:Transposase n=1 Tax=Haemonchus placei TaxID=6290 RepID=A0A0N4WNT8_HAEPC|nr:unnamed protein product [Haemonchus placei]